MASLAEQPYEPLAAATSALGNFAGSVAVAALSGFVLLAMFGWAIIQGDSPDFGLFGSRALNVSMFAALFILFRGAASAAVRLDRPNAAETVFPEAIRHRVSPRRPLSFRPRCPGN